MKNNLNATEWRIEEGAIIAVLALFLISIILSCLLWHVKIPFTNDIIWSNWPPLAKAIWGYIWSLLGIQTDSWMNLFSEPLPTPQVSDVVLACILSRLSK